MKFEYYEDTAGEWRWRLKARNHKIIAVGGEGFTTKDACIESILLVQECCNGEQTVMITEVDNATTGRS